MSAVSPEAKARQREQDRLYRRKIRAALHAKGLRWDGKPIRFPKISIAMRKTHPADCLCYDCLWGEKT